MQGYNKIKYCPLIILLIIQIYSLFNNFYSISADEAGHTLYALKFYEGGSLFGIWLPFQKVFAGLFLWIDLFWTPRIVAMIFGQLTLFALILLTDELFKDKRISLIAGILGSLFVGITVFSVVPLTEIYFFFFLLLSVYFLLKKSNWIYLAVFLMTTVRFEGWIFAFIIMVLLYKKDGLKVLSLMIFPLFWVILGYFETGSLTGFISQVSERKKVWRTEDSILYNFLYMSLVSGLVLGLVYLKKNKTYLWLFLTTLLLWTVGTSFSGAMATHNVWRTGLLWSLMLIPFTAYLINQIYQYQKIFAIILFIFISALTLNQTLAHSNESYTKVNDLQAGQFIKTLDGNIIMPKYGWEYSNLLITGSLDIVYKDNITSINGIDYLILMQPINDKRFIEVYHNDKWIIYKHKGE